LLQLEKLKNESGEDITGLRRDVMRSKEESQELTLKAETGRLQAAQEAKQQIHKLSAQLEEMQKKQEVEVCGKFINAVHTDLNDFRESIKIQESMSIT